MYCEVDVIYSAARLTPLGARGRPSGLADRISAYEDTDPPYGRSASAGLFAV